MYPSHTPLDSSATSAGQIAVERPNLPMMTRLAVWVARRIHKRNLTPDGHKGRTNHHVVHGLNQEQTSRGVIWRGLVQISHVLVDAVWKQGNGLTLGRLALPGCPDRSEKSRGMPGQTQERALVSPISLENKICIAAEQIPNPLQDGGCCNRDTT